MLHLDTQVLRGIPSSPGVAFGRAMVIKPEKIFIPSLRISEEKIEEELIRFKTAISEVNKELLTVLNKIKRKSPNVAAVLETNLFIVSDHIFMTSITDRIKKCFSAENSVIQEFDAQKQYLQYSKDTILRERALELDHIKERIISALRNRTVHYAISPDSIVVAQSVSPTDVVFFKESKVLAIITEVGGITSHSSILTRSFEIPSVIGIMNATELIPNESNLIIDGYSGIVAVNPDKVTTERYQQKKNQEKEQKRKLGKLLKLPSETKDGRHISLLANADFPDDVENAILVGAEGIGLVRSEHLVFSKGQFPDEEEQFRFYNEIAERAYPKPVTLRTFDVGSDKYAEGMPRHENNPALGFRGIRFLLQRRDLFETQIRAILRASKNKNLRLMIPMVSTVNEVRESITIIEKCKNELSIEHIDFDPTIEVGIMIETPSAAIIADKMSMFAKFFSIGTNDLTQYTLAADRTNELVSDSFDSFHPSILRLIKMTVDAAANMKINVGVCGELAGHAAATALLIGLGVKELSVSPSILLELKSRLMTIDYNDSVNLADEIISSYSYDEIREKLSLY